MVVVLNLSERFLAIYDLVVVAAIFLLSFEGIRLCVQKENLKMGAIAAILNFGSVQF